MAKTLIHLGIAKTGTTLFQQHLFSDEQVFYPLGRYGVGGDQCIDETIRELVWEGVFLDEYHWNTHASRFRTTVQQHLAAADAGERIPVLSNEAMAMSGAGASDLDRRMARLAWLVGGDATVLVLTRAQFPWLKSMYSSAVCDGGASLSLQRFLDIQSHDPLHRMNHVACLDYEHLHTVISRHFARVVMLPFEAIFTAAGPDMGPIADALGVGPLRLPSQQVNASRTPEHIARARAINARFSRGASAAVDALPNMFQRRIFRDALARTKAQQPVSAFARTVVSGTLAERKQQMLTMHDEKGLQQMCEILRIAPLVDGAEPLDAHRQWCRETFGESNRRIDRRLGLDLGRYGYDGCSQGADG